MRRNSIARFNPGLRRASSLGKICWLILSGILAIAFCNAEDAPLTADSARNPIIQWVSNSTTPNQVTVEVTGLEPALLQQIEQGRWDKARWQRLLSVYAEQGDIKADVGLPPMLGTYRITQGRIRFEPQFPLEPRISYRAVFDVDALPDRNVSGAAPVVTRFQMPAPSAPTTVVAQIYPTAEVLPENLLKFYLHFSAPMSGGHIYDHIHLQNEQGKEIELPFLEIDEELWDPSMTRLTLFIDPGRIKRGVRPLEEVGPALEAGKRFTLVIDRTWKDGNGNPLKEDFRKTFRVDQPDRNALDPNQWTIETPKAGTLEVLTVKFPKPLDHALAQRLIGVGDAAAHRVEGTIELADQERRWIFKPGRPWGGGGYQLVAQTALEDLAGNNIGKPFEVDLFEGVQRQVTNTFVKLPFEVR